MTMRTLYTYHVVIKVENDLYRWYIYDGDKEFMKASELYSERSEAAYLGNKTILNLFHENKLPGYEVKE